MVLIVTWLAGINVVVSIAYIVLYAIDLYKRKTLLSACKEDHKDEAITTWSKSKLHRLTKYIYTFMILLSILVISLIGMEIMR